MPDSTDPYEQYRAQKAAEHRSERAAVRQAAEETAARTARSEALRLDGIREYGVSERRPAEEQQADPDLATARSAGITADELLARLQAAAARREPAATGRLVAALERLLGTKAQQEHAAQTPQPVEIRRPDLTPVEGISATLVAVLNVSIGIAVVRAAARRVFGVELSRRQAWLLMLAGAALTRGSGWQVWTRQQRKAGR